MEHHSQRTIRYTALGAETFTSPLSTGCIVIFAQNAAPETKTTAYLQLIARLRLRGSSKAVLHLRHPGPVAESLQAEMNEITVIVHPWSPLAVSYDIVAGAVPNILCTLLDTLRGVQQAAKRIIVVGLERLSPACLGLDSVGADLTATVAAVLVQMRAPPSRAYQYVPPGFLSEPYTDPLCAILDDMFGSTRRCPMDSCSMGEYRRIVGREQFEIEANEGVLW